MSTVASIAVAFLGGSVGGSAISAWMTTRTRRTVRRGRARFVHEDFVRLQSSVTRIVRASGKAKPEQARSWLLSDLADAEAQQDVLAHLSGWRFGACASALGWGKYLRKSYKDGAEAPSEDELTQIYKRLAGGRAALADLASLEYMPHNIASVVGRDAARAPLTDKLPRITYANARRDAKHRTGEDN